MRTSWYFHLSRFHMTCSEHMEMGLQYMKRRSATRTGDGSFGVVDDLLVNIHGNLCSK